MPPINDAPYEIIASPVTLYLAPAGTAFPAIGAAPGVSWTKVGKNGDRNYMEDGVSIANPQTIEFFRPLGTTFARKAFRTAEDVRVKVTLADVSLEAYQLALNGNAISTVAEAVGPPAVPGHKKINVKRGFRVTRYALLAVGPSAEGEDITRHFRLNVTVQVGEPEVVHKKGEAAGLALEFAALEDDNGDVGEIVDELPAA